VDKEVAEELLKNIPEFGGEEQDFDTYLLTSLRNLYRKHNL
jgi:hypothetical protein